MGFLMVQKTRQTRLLEGSPKEEMLYLTQSVTREGNNDSFLQCKYTQIDKKHS